MQLHKQKLQNFHQNQTNKTLVILKLLRNSLKKKTKFQQIFLNLIEILLDLKVDGIRTTFRQSINEQFPVHDKALNKHLLRTLFGIHVHKRVLVIGFVPTINSYLIYTK